MLLMDESLLRAVTNYDASGRPRASHDCVTAEARRLCKPDNSELGQLAARAKTVTGFVFKIAAICQRVVTARRAQP